MARNFRKNLMRRADTIFGYRKFKTFKSKSIDPLNKISPKGPWIFGSFALHRFYRHILNIEPHWQPNDIDYCVRNDIQYDMLNTLLTEKANDITVINELNVKHYICDDYTYQLGGGRPLHVVNRFDWHILDINQVAHDGEQFFVLKTAIPNIKNFRFKVDRTLLDKKSHQYNKWKDEHNGKANLTLEEGPLSNRQHEIDKWLKRGFGQI